MVSPRDSAMTPRPFTCNVCSRGFTRAENLQRHKKARHGGANAEKFECVKCHSKFSRRDVCKRHSDNCSGAEASSKLVAPEVSRPPQPLGMASGAKVSPRKSGNLNLGEQFEEWSVPVTSFSPEYFRTPEDSQHLWRNEPPKPPPFLPFDEVSRYIESYFENFHPALPIIHRATISPLSTPSIMLKILTAIGCMYTEAPQSPDDRMSHQKRSDDLWRSGGAELEAFVLEDQRRLRTYWVLQSWILCIVYGTFAGNEKHISKARRMYRFMVDAIRDLELLHQKSTVPPSVLWSASIDLNMLFDEEVVQKMWLTFVEQESMKVAMYAFYFFDYHLFMPSNIRPSVSSIEFEWELPVSESLWEAATASAWWECLQRNLFDVQPIANSATLEANRDGQTMSLLAVTQSLLINNPSSRLLSVLAASPFATLCVVTNLECLVRDFTRCYYQLPPNPSDPSPFHILSQSQNAQIATALTTIWGLMGDGPCSSCGEDCKSLWHAVRIGCLSVKVSLSKPDDLLVGGIVENNPTAGLATAAHLTLGNYVTSRRSASSWKKKTIGDEGFLSILDDLMKSMHELAAPVTSQAWEGPWVFIQGFRMLLILWRALRISLAEIFNQTSAMAGQARYLKLSNPGKMLVDTVISGLELFIPREIEVGKEDPIDLEDAEQIETEYILLMHQVCNRRLVWDAGQSMTKVLEEISAMTTEPISFRR